MLNAAHALLRFRRLGRRSLGRSCALRCSRFLGLWSDNRTLREGDREFGLKVGERKPRGLIHTSPSTGSCSAFFLVDFLVAVVVVDFVWRVELRVARVDVVTASGSPSSPRFLLNDTQHGVHSNH